MFSLKQCPFTGPYGLPISDLKSKGPTAEALKRAMSRLGLLPWTDFDQHYNQQLAHALDKWDPGNSGYGKGRWLKIRSCRVPAGLVHAGEYALDTVALNLIREEYNASLPPLPVPPQLVFPIDKNWASRVPSFLHPTGGIPGNWALDWMCEPGAIVLASEAGTVSRTAGHDPRTGLHGANRDVFGWSVYLRCKTGFYYDTHFGRLSVRAGESVKAGDPIGYVGDWPYDRGRSHLHRGFTSFTLRSSVSIRKIQVVAGSPRVEANTL